MAPGVATWGCLFPRVRLDLKNSQKKCTRLQRELDTVQTFASIAAILDREKWRIRSEKCERGCSGSLIVMLERRGICAPAIIVVGNSVDSLVRPRSAGLQLEATKQIGTAAHNARWNVLVILPFSCYLGSQVAGKNGALTKVAVLRATFPKEEVFGFSLFTAYCIHLPFFTL